MTLADQLVIDTALIEAGMRDVEQQLNTGMTGEVLEYTILDTRETERVFIPSEYQPMFKCYCKYAELSGVDRFVDEVRRRAEAYQGHLQHNPWIPERVPNRFCERTERHWSWMVVLRGACKAVDLPILRHLRAREGIQVPVIFRNGDKPDNQERYSSDYFINMVKISSVRNISHPILIKCKKSEARLADIALQVGPGYISQANTVITNQRSYAYPKYKELVLEKVIKRMMEKAC